MRSKLSTIAIAQLRNLLQSKPGTCNVEMDLPEKKLVGLNARTQVGLEGAVTAEITGKLRNLTGNCEHHSITFGHSKPTLQDAETELAYRLRFPRILGRGVHAQTTINQQFQNCQADSSYTERQRGIGFDLIRCAYEIKPQMRTLQCLSSKRSGSCPQCASYTNLCTSMSVCRAQGHAW